MAGLQGSGKTTTTAKLALRLRKKGRRPLLVACDTRRPAAIEQLRALGKQLDVSVYDEGPEPAPPDIAERGRRARTEHGPRRGDRRHERSSADRRRAHGRDRGDRIARRAGRDLARGRRDDGSGGRERRARLPRAACPHRPGADQGRRRCPRRRRGLVDARGHRRADQVPRHRREARRAGGPSSRTVSPGASWAKATCSASSSAPRPRSTWTRRKPRSWSASCARESSTWRTSSSSSSNSSAWGRCRTCSR